MELLIGIVGMVALAGLYVALGLADRGGAGCDGCRLQEDLESACRACAEDREPRTRTVTQTGGPVPASPPGDGRRAAADRGTG